MICIVGTALCGMKHPLWVYTFITRTTRVVWGYSYMILRHISLHSRSVYGWIISDPLARPQVVSVPSKFDSHEQTQVKGTAVTTRRREWQASFLSHPCISGGIDHCYDWEFKPTEPWAGRGRELYESSWGRALLKLGEAGGGIIHWCQLKDSHRCFQSWCTVPTSTSHSHLGASFTVTSGQRLTIIRVSN